MTKSYVTVEQAVCLVCGKTFDTGSLLLDRRMRDTFQPKTVTHFALCEEDQAKFDAGYIAVVAVDESKSKAAFLPNGNVLPNGIWRIGEAAYIQRPVWNAIFDVPAPKEGVAFIGHKAFEMLKKKLEK